MFDGIDFSKLNMNDIVNKFQNIQETTKEENEKPIAQHRLSQMRADSLKMKILQLNMCSLSSKNKFSRFNT